MHYKQILFFFSLLFVCNAGQNWANDCIKIDLNKKSISFFDYPVGKVKINATFNYQVSSIEGGTALSLESTQFRVDHRVLPWLKLKFVKRGKMLFINYVRTPELTLNGHLDLATNQVLFNIDISTKGAFLAKNSVPSPISGNIFGKVKIWGKLGDFFTSGTMTLYQGKCNNVDFSRLSLNFLGKLPVLNLSNSEVTLKDGSIYRIDGVMNFSKIKDLVSLSGVSSQKVTLGGWEIASEEKKNVGIKRNLDDNIAIRIDTYNQQDESFLDSGAELRLKVQNEGFLRLRMQEDKAILGFEKKKEF